MSVGAFPRSRDNGCVMHSASAISDGLDHLILNAMKTARERGRADVVSRLEAALQASGTSTVARFELDIPAAEVRRDGAAVQLSPGERAVLIALALQRRPSSRAELIELLYPHLEDSTAATQLKVYVHRVRRRLGDPQTIVFKDNSYRLGPQVDVDFWDVEAEVGQAMRTSGALAPEARGRLDQIRRRLVRRDISWIGDRDWSNTLERRLASLLFDVTARLGEAALAEGDLAAASCFAAEIFSLDPCDERGAQLTIRVHLAAGDRLTAVREFRRYERVLRAEFAAQPSSELTALLAGDIAS